MSTIGYYCSGAENSEFHKFILRSYNPGLPLSSFEKPFNRDSSIWKLDIPLYKTQESEKEIPPAWDEDDHALVSYYDGPSPVLSPLDRNQSLTPIKSYAQKYKEKSNSMEYSSQENDLSQENSNSLDHQYFKGKNSMDITDTPIYHASQHIPNDNDLSTDEYDPESPYISDDDENYNNENKDDDYQDEQYISQRSNPSNTRHSNNSLTHSQQGRYGYQPISSYVDDSPYSSPPNHSSPTIHYKKGFIDYKKSNNNYRYPSERSDHYTHSAVKFDPYYKSHPKNSRPNHPTATIQQSFTDYSKPRNTEYMRAHSLVKEDDDDLDSQELLNRGENFTRPFYGMKRRGGKSGFNSYYGPKSSINTYKPRDYDPNRADRNIIRRPPNISLSHPNRVDYSDPSSSDPRSTKSFYSKYTSSHHNSDTEIEPLHQNSNELLQTHRKVHYALRKPPFNPSYNKPYNNSNQNRNNYDSQYVKKPFAPRKTYLGEPFNAPREPTTSFSSNKKRWVTYE